MGNFTLHSGRTSSPLRIKSSEKLFNILILIRSPWRYYHCRRVGTYASIIANNIGMSKDHVRYLKIAGIVHDIGFSAINDRILDKESSLTREEYTIVKFHPMLGMRLLDCYGFPQEIIQAVVQHHESFDGSGYPLGLKGSQISMYGRILFLAEAFDTMTSDTPYRHASTIDAAMESIKEMSDKVFDPELVNAVLDSQELAAFCMKKGRVQPGNANPLFPTDDLFSL